MLAAILCSIGVVPMPPAPAIDVGGRNPWMIERMKQDRLAMLRRDDDDLMALVAEFMKHL